MGADIEFFFDYVSPNAYLAWQRIRPIAAQSGRRLEAVPVLFAGLLQAHGQLGPAEIEPKRRWMTGNCLRKASHFGIALRAPAAHPFKPLLALRVTQALAGAAQYHKVIDALFAAAWAESRDISDAATVTEILADCDCDASALVAQAGSEAASRRLRAATDAAIARGVFGVPTIIVGDELFFGCDDLPWLEQYLNGDDCLDTAERDAWLAVQPGARRRAR